MTTERRSWGGPALDEIERLRAQRQALRRLIADDAWAASFQTLGQYRSALLSALDRSQS